MKKLALVLLSLASVNAFAAVDLAKSEFTWKGEKVIAGGHVGTIKAKSAELVVEKNMIKSGKFEFDMNSITPTDVSGDNLAKLSGHLKSPDFFDVANHPTATFVITKVEGAKVTGDLTVRGKTHPITFDVKQEGKTFTGTSTFDRTKFDVMYSAKPEQSAFDKLEKTAKEKVIKNEIVLNFKVVQK